jgi:hypothetical protein
MAPLLALQSGWLGHRTRLIPGLIPQAEHCDKGPKPGISDSSSQLPFQTWCERIGYAFGTLMFIDHEYQAVHAESAPAMLFGFIQLLAQSSSTFNVTPFQVSL